MITGRKRTNQDNRYSIIKDRMNPDTIRHYLFDLYGTLVDIHTDEEKPEVWEQTSRWFREQGAVYEPEALKRCYHYEIYRQSEALNVAVPMIEHKEIRLESVFWNLFSNKGIHPSEKLLRETGWFFRKASTEYIRLYPGTIELLSRLRKQGKVWLLSNAQSLFTRPELDKLGLTPYLDGICISSDQMCKKPDMYFYRALLEREKIPAEEAVMIGNDEFCDIQGAKRAGLHTVYLHSNLSPEFNGSDADLVLNPLDLRALSDLLEKNQECLQAEQTSELL